MDSEQYGKEMLDLPFKNKLYRFALKFVGSTYDAEDILQELLIKIWNRKEQYADIENKEAWCMTVTRNLCIDKTRAKKVSSMDVSDYHHLSDGADTQDKVMEKDERMSSIMVLVNQLPEKQREIVFLRDVEGYTYQEIADLTDNSLDFVKVSLHRARKSLKDQLIKRNFKKYNT